MSERHQEHRPHEKSVSDLLKEIIELIRVNGHPAHDDVARRLLHAIDHRTEELDRKLSIIIRKENTLMSLSQRELDAFAALIADIDAKFQAANAPLIAELTAQRDAALAEDSVDQAEVDRLSALIATAEQDTLDAIQSVQDHVDGLGGTPTTTTTPAPEPPVEEPA